MGFRASGRLTLTVPSSLAVHIHFECFSKPTAAASDRRPCFTAPKRPNARHLASGNSGGDRIGSLLRQMCQAGDGQGESAAQATCDVACVAVKAVDRLRRRCRHLKDLDCRVAGGRQQLLVCRDLKLVDLLGAVACLHDDQQDPSGMRLALPQAHTA